MKLEEKKIATLFALIMGGWHTIWSLLVLFGLAQPLLNFVFWMHMLTTPYKVVGFNFTQALTLIIVTSICGYIGGWVIAKVWNSVHR